MCVLAVAWLFLLIKVSFHETLLFFLRQIHSNSNSNSNSFSPHFFTPSLLLLPSKSSPHSLHILSPLLLIPLFLPNPLLTDSHRRTRRGIRGIRGYPCRTWNQWVFGGILRPSEARWSPQRLAEALRGSLRPSEAPQSPLRLPQKLLRLVGAL